MVADANVVAMQFHPEKSGANGLAILANWVRCAVVTVLYPAIDLRGGRCVRLHQGDYGRETVYGDDPVAQALAFADAGASWVHVVDLDAARSGDPTNRPVIAAVAGALAERGVAVQTGGGVRSVADAAELAAAGVARVVLGTAAVADPSLVDAVVEQAGSPSRWGSTCGAGRSP